MSAIGIAAGAVAAAVVGLLAALLAPSRCALAAGPHRTGAVVGSLRDRARRSVAGQRAGTHEAQEVRRLAAAVRGGATVLRALDGLASAGGPWAHDAAQVVAEVGHGQRLHEAVDRWARRSPSPGPTLVAGALALAEASGGALAEALDAVARSLTDRAELHREVAAASSSARASAMVLVATPLAFALAVSVADPRVGHVLVATPLGAACLALALGLDLAGAGWIRRMVRQVGT